ncbi:hypothetical protein [Trichormus azollae]|nr:hypothetical protein [Trichormus azollae]
MDDHLEKYPTWTHGRNGQDHYADIEAVRVCGEGAPARSTYLTARDMGMV